MSTTTSRCPAPPQDSHRELRSFFTDVTKACNKRAPGSGCPAVEGEHHNHAVLGATQHCVATHPSDMGVALTAFNAVVTYETADGSGELPLADFYLPVRDTPHRETALPPGALITGVTLPPAPVAAHSRYHKVRERASYVFAIGSIAAALDRFLLGTAERAGEALAELAEGVVTPAPGRVYASLVRGARARRWWHCRPTSPEGPCQGTTPINHRLAGRNWTTRFTYGWITRLGVYRLTGIVHRATAHASR